ncbi:MAG: hypothetical protein ACREUQ_13755, partial [Burkholderiales bacterium]
LRWQRKGTQDQNKNRCVSPLRIDQKADIWRVTKTGHLDKLLTQPARRGDLGHRFLWCGDLAGTQGSRSEVADRLVA